jgi:hypothetical protein
MPEAVFGLHLLLFVVWIPALLVYAPKDIRVPEIHTPKDAFDALKIPFRGTPRWMLYMLFSFLGYTVINIIIIFFSPNNQSAISTPVIRFFSSAWMAAYSFSLAVLYSKAQIQKKDNVRKCVNGHQVSSEAVFCAQCGQMILDEVK